MVQQPAAVAVARWRVKALFPIFRPVCGGMLAAAMSGVAVTRANAATPDATAGSAPSAETANTTVSAAPYSLPEDIRDLLKVDAAMRSYFAPLLTAPPGSADRLQQIVDAVVKPTGLNFAYDIEGTYHPAETFRRRRGNCVSFAFLMVSVAREFGFSATFQNVESAVRWTRFGTVVASVMHLDVRVETDDGLYLVDLRPDLLPSKRLEAMRLISDERAIAEFYDTVGVFRLVHGAPDDARRCMQRATQIDPTLAAHWRNLGNVHVRGGDLASARSCFERALRADRNDLSAASSLLEILRQSGMPEDLRSAAKLERRAMRMRDQNPYWQERLARLAQEQGDWTEAEKRYRRAVGLNGEELEFYAPWIATLRHLGREADAQRAEVKLEKLRTRIARQSIHVSGQ